MRKPRLPVVDWIEAPTDLNGLVRFGERRNLVSACVPSRSARALTTDAPKSYDGRWLPTMQWGTLAHRWVVLKGKHFQNWKTPNSVYVWDVLWQRREALGRHLDMEQSADRVARLYVVYQQELVLVLYPLFRSNRVIYDMSLYFHNTLSFYILRSCDRAWMHQFHKFILSWNSTCFWQFVCPSSGVHSLYTQQWCMSYRFVDSFRPGPWWNSSSILVLLESCLQTCMTYHCWVYSE